MKRLKRPSADAMSLAAAWLRVYEASPGDMTEVDDCKAVADWLLQQIEDQDDRDVAKEVGVSVKTLRKLRAKHAQ